jgi:hypothetical protein
MTATKAKSKEKKAPSNGHAIRIDEKSLKDISIHTKKLQGEITGYVIADDAGFDQAGKWLQHIVTCRKRIKEICAEPIRLAKEMKAALDRQQDELDKPYADADRWLRPQWIAYNNKKKQEELIRAVEQQAVNQKMLEAAAKRLEAAGQKEMAAKIVENAKTQPAVIPQSAPKQEGISTRKYPKARVTDFKMLVIAVANDLAPIDCLMGNQSFLNGQAKMLGKSLNYPGVEYYEDEGLNVHSI